MPRKLKGHDPGNVTPKKPVFLIYGKGGVGKTWGSLDFPSVYYIDTEGGADQEHYTKKLKQSGGLYVGPDDGANDFPVVLDELVTLASTDHGYRTLVIDSYSKLFNTAVDLEFEKMEHAGRDMSKTFGAEKKPAIAYTRRMVRWFEKLDMNIILICHQRDAWKNGECVGVTFDGWDKLEYELDLSINIIKQGADRKAKIAKSRLLGFPDATVFEWSYMEFAKRYGQEVIESPTHAIHLATPDQVKAIISLIDAVRIDDGQVDKWLSKAGADRFENMDTETIQKCIDFLAKKLPTKGATA